MSFLPDHGGAVPLVVYQLTAGQLAELVERIVERVAAGPRKAAVKVPEAARLLAISEESLRRRIKAKLVQTLPGMGPVRIPMAEIDRLNGQAESRKLKAES